MVEMLTTFDALFAKKLAEPPTDDLLSRIIHSEAMGHMPDQERVANLALLIVGGNDTTRNSMSAFAHIAAMQPEHLEQLRKDPSLIPNAVQEVIRWQSPVTHMRRTCTKDTELGGQKLRRGDKVVLWPSFSTPPPAGTAPKKHRSFSKRPRKTLEVPARKG